MASNYRLYAYEPDKIGWILLDKFFVDLDDVIRYMLTHSPASIGGDFWSAWGDGGRVAWTDGDYVVVARPFSKNTRIPISPLRDVVELIKEANR